MCGIFGIIGRQDKDLLKKMDFSLSHRGPDSSGEIHFEDVSIGARRLSIIDLEKGDQPIHNEDKNLWVVQNGEIYNYKELKSILIGKGHKFYTNSDTEVIVHAYEEFEEKCVNYFNGMFAFVIWDIKRKRLFGARDRLGIKPFFYTHSGKMFLFASEIKALLQEESFKREVDITAFYNYLSRLFVQGSRTIFKNINSLPPAHTFMFENGNLKLKEYWDINLKNKIECSENEYKENILDKLEKSVKRQLVSDVPVGAFLSGGIDSNAVVAFMAKHSNSQVQTFTMGYTGNENHLINELDYARESASFFKTEHHEVTINPSMVIDNLAEMIWFFDEPYAGSLPQYYLSKLASNCVKVALCGAGGDEVFGDYGRGVGIAKSLNRFHRYFFKMSNLDKLYHDHQAIFKEEIKREILNPAILNQVNSSDTLRNIFIGFMNKTSSRSVEDLVMYADVKTQLVNEYLRYTDVLSMAHSLEVRVPLLDHELVEYAASIPFRYLVQNNDSKYLFKQAVKPVLPSGTTERRKGYFSLPYGTWLRNELRPFVLNVLSKNKINKMGYFDFKKVNEIIEAQYKGDDTSTYKVWNLLMFSLWHSIFIENNFFDISQVKNWKDIYLYEKI